MLLCDPRGIYMSKTMEFLDFGELFRVAERATLTVYLICIHMITVYSSTGLRLLLAKIKT